MKEIKTYQCSYCNSLFNDKNDCCKHEETCKNKVLMKSIITDFDFISGDYNHRLRYDKYINKENFKCYVNVTGNCAVDYSIIDKITNISSEKHRVSLIVYTLNDDAQYEKEVFNSMHDFIKEKMKEIKENWKIIETTDFKNYKN